MGQERGSWGTGSAVFVVGVIVVAVVVGGEGCRTAAGVADGKKCGGVWGSGTAAAEGAWGDWRWVWRGGSWAEVVKRGVEDVARRGRRGW